MAWYLNDIRIFVQAEPEVTTTVMSRHNTLGGGSIHQVYGYEEPSIKLTCIVVGEDDKNALHSLTTSGTTFTLETPWGNKTVWVERVNASARMTSKQSIRGDLDCYATVYDVELDLFEED
jgi:hypothetical protein